MTPNEKSMELIGIFGWQLPTVDLKTSGKCVVVFVNELMKLSNGLSYDKDYWEAVKQETINHCQINIK